MSVIDCLQLTFAVEFQVEVVGQFHIIAVTFLVDFDNYGFGEIGFHIVGNGSWDEGCGYAAGLSFHLVPYSFLVKLQFHSIVEAYLVFCL